MSNYLNEDGMTLRDYFAAKAMQGIIIRFGEEPPYLLNTSDNDAEAETARYSYEIADMMMLAREE